MGTRKRDVSKINLKIAGIKFIENGMCISWVSDIGWGEYWLCLNEKGGWEADSECMDKGDDKEFLKELLDLAKDHILKQALIVG